MTEPKWHLLDHRETHGGGYVVYHWRLDAPEKVCEASGEVVSIHRDRCANHAGGMHPCRVWVRTPECDHRHLDPEQQQPTCLTCGQVGEDVTAEMGG